jgi:hypothetical protein
MPAMAAKTYKPAKAAPSPEPVEPIAEPVAAPIVEPITPTPASAYDRALSLIRQVDDVDFRRALIDALIVEHVKRAQGFDDPAGALAMKLRGEAIPPAEKPISTRIFRNR